MRLTRVRWWRYSIPFRTPFVTAHGVLTKREGVLLELTSENGICGLGEVAPLPGFGGSVEGVWQQLPAVAGYLLENVAAEGPWSLGNDITNRWPAALRCGVDTALLDLAGRTTSRSMAMLLTLQPQATVPVNATVGSSDTGTAVQLAVAAVAVGFGTVKLKVGSGTSIQTEVERISAVREAIGPVTKLRLDANEAWTPETAIAVIRACEQYRPEWVEQPVRAGDVGGLAAVRRAVGTPIAVDESVTGAESVRALLAAGAADVLILKPMMLGGPAATLRLAELASAAGIETVVTSTLETGVGLAAVAHAATALPGPWRACGLATAALLEDDLLEESLRIEDGHLLLPEAPGLGVSLDREKLRHYTIVSGEATARR